MMDSFWWDFSSYGQFSKQVTALVEALEKRVLPAFESIAQEAEEEANRAWEEFMSLPGDGDEEPGDFAEDAAEAGQSYYSLLMGIKQGLLNLFAAALFHLVEQQIVMFLRLELMSHQEAVQPKLFKKGIDEFKKRLAQRGVNVEGISSWAKVEELELLANTVKHAEGDSAQKLSTKRPDHFVHPALPKPLFNLGVSSRPPFLPLAGENLYVSLEAIKEYRDAIVAFWEELRSTQQPRGWKSVRTGFGVLKKAR